MTFCNTAIPLVSAIVPVHNGEAFLAEAIASIRAQEGADIEIIVVDDGSTDASAEIAQKIPGIHLHRQLQSGVAAARNAGLALSRGRYIAFLDADDVWLPGKIAAQLAALADHPDAAYSLTQVRHVDISGAASPLLDDTARLGRLMQCLLAPRQVFDAIGGFSSGTVTRADQDWFLRADEAQLRPVVVSQVLVHRRLHHSNNSLRNQHQVGEDLLTIARRALQRRRQQGKPLNAIEEWSP
jgi:glycosyltransferase involved in cell wall biosynthesis